MVAKCKVAGCAWRLRAAVKNEPSTFWVTKYVKSHTCSVSDRVRKHKRCTTKYIGKLFLDRTGLIEGIVPQHIRDSMRRMFGMKLDYTASYRALKHAQDLVWGTVEEGYANLPSYLQSIKEANPGSYLRRVIVVDGTHLTGKYGGALLVAAGQDANFQIFPLAFAVVDGEDNESWEWFFNKLRDCFRQLPPMAIVSDRAAAIARALESLCPGHQEEYVTITSKKADPKLWSRVHFEGDRYNIKTSNIAESINSAVKKAKGLPIPRLLEFIREKLGRWFSKRREDALSLTTIHSRGVEYILAIRSYYAGTAAEANVDMSYYVCATHSKPSLFSTYAHPLYPKAGTDSHVKPVRCLPPGESVPRGRPKKSRWQTWLELSRKKNNKPRKMHKKYSCSKCKEPGHTRPNCVAED
ncbi:unnamed protein product [Microthlaspi erraticum]|uniref:MULE transposase domain-containing protein n=1 Tax=Microthlaspi erraticum TaxID=1685480 RepID=A0A6D2HKD7_9BRAS|nr:unnamed protein product [Microthlaspi erraticum]